MTYKKIVSEMVRREADNFINKVFTDNGYNVRWTTSFEPEMEKDKERDTIFWTVRAEVKLKDEITSRKFEIGGTVDDCCLVCCSVINNDDHKIIWMSNPATRQKLGIDKLKI